MPVRKGDWLLFFGEKETGFPDWMSTYTAAYVWALRAYLKRGEET